MLARTTVLHHILSYLVEVAEAEAAPCRPTSFVESQGEEGQAGLPEDTLESICGGGAGRQLREALSLKRAPELGLLPRAFSVVMCVSELP